MSIKLKIKKIHPDAKIPSYAHPGDAGFDLVYVGDNFTLNPGEREILPTGIQMEIPFGYELQIRPRSGLAAKHGITILNTPGTVDCGYRGEIKVIAINHGEEPYHLEKGERIAQGVISKLEEVSIEEVSELSDSSRGEGGFGSTGK